MNNTFEYIVNKYKLETEGKRIVDIPNVGRYDFADLIFELGFKNGVEIGVANGYFSEILCKANPQMKLIGVDPFLPYNGYNDYDGKQLTFDVLEKEAKKKLFQFSNYEFMKKMSMDAVKEFKDESQDFVFIDANHQDPYITQDIVEWSKKVRSGGIVSGHDFINIAGVNWDVKKAIGKYIRENNIKPLFVLGLATKNPGLTRELHRSWFFIKS